jgi:putative acetyltransferase
MRLDPIDLDDPQVLDLLRLHLDGMHESSPPGTVFALDVSGLRRPDITFLGAWDDDTLLGFGALRQLSPAHGEIKSMRTAPDHLRRGVATAILEALLDLARASGCRRVSLETGTGPAFEPALQLYRRSGFVNGEPFGDYVPSDFNQFLHLSLTDRPSSSP